MDNFIGLISIIFIIVLLYFSIVYKIKSLLRKKRRYNKGYSNRKSKRIPNYEETYIHKQGTPFLHKIPEYELKGKADVSEFLTSAIGNKTIINKYHNAKFILSNKLDEIK